jgi:hypothetical protein
MNICKLLLSEWAWALTGDLKILHIIGQKKACSTEVEEAILIWVDV